MQHAEKAYVTGIFFIFYPHFLHQKLLFRFARRSVSCLWVKMLDAMLLYKYLTPESAFQVLGNGTLQYTQPMTFNDPYDCQFDMRPDYEPEDATKVVEGVRNRLWGFYCHGLDPDTRVHVSTREIILDLRNQLPAMDRRNFDECKGVRCIVEGVKLSLKDYLPVTVPKWQRSAKVWRDHSIVLCLSECFKNILMWSHYAKNHEGVVLGFSAAQNSYLQMAEPVRYQLTVPKFITQEQIIESLTGELDQDAFDFEGVAKKQIFTKACCWSYEKERRVVLDGRSHGVPETKKRVLLPFDEKELTKIYIGHGASGVTQKIIIVLAAQFPNVEIYRIKALEREYALDFERVL
jgi:hypothetical protein